MYMYYFTPIYIILQIDITYYYKIDVNCYNRFINLFSNNFSFLNNFFKK